MKPEAAAAYVDATAEILGLPIPADCRPAVIAGFQGMAAMAGKVNGFTLPTEIEPAPVFGHAKR